MTRPIERCSAVARVGAFLTAVLLLGVFATGTRAVILFRSGEPAENTTAPSGDLANSGWQYQGLWGDFTGTPIATFFFISAKHLGHQGSFHWNGKTYSVVAKFDDPQSDLTILQVAEAFPSFAPLYSRTDEVGQRIAEFGRGTQRGASITVSGQLKGWRWGGSDAVLRWGENVVSGTYPFGADNELLFANFDAAGLPNECHLSVGDSGGAAFINDDGVWKLAGINYSVSGPFKLNPADAEDPERTPAEREPFQGALFDARGIFALEGDSYVLVTGDQPVPTALYPTRISRRLPWIASIVAQQVPGYEVGFATLTYTRFILPPTDVVYQVEQSTDLVTWTAAAPNEEVTPSGNGITETVKVRVEAGPSDRLFLRLRISRP